MKQERSIFSKTPTKSPLRTPTNIGSKSPFQQHSLIEKEKPQTVTLALDLTKFKKQPESKGSILADLRNDISKLSKKMISKNPNLFSPTQG